MTSAIRLLHFLLTPTFDGPLHAPHDADLRKSGLTDATVRLQRFRSVPPGMIGQLLGFDPPQVTSALLLPYPDPQGGFLPHIRLKAFPSYIGRRGETVKYLQPPGSRSRLYFPLATLPDVLGGGGRLVFVEGEKKALAVAQLGIPAVGFAGIEGWHAAGSRTLLSDFDVIPLEHRTVEVLPDGDVRTNVNVERGVRRFAEALEARGARVRLVLVPLLEAIA